MGADFAKRHLNSLGWESGQGLGREKQGISTAIKPELKSDQAGLGHIAEDFGFAWWDHCFNKAAKKIEVSHCEKSGEVKVKAAKTKVETKLSERRAPKELLYGCFVAAKKEGEEEEHHGDDESRDHSSLSKLTDEEILKRCGGRTAHKGARHGIRQVAKLQRAKEHKLLHVAGEEDTDSDSGSDGEADDTDSSTPQQPPAEDTGSEEKKVKEKKKSKKEKVKEGKKEKKERDSKADKKEKKSEKKKKKEKDTSQVEETTAGAERKETTKKEKSAEEKANKKKSKKEKKAEDTPATSDGAESGKKKRKSSKEEKSEKKKTKRARTDETA